MAMNTHPVSPGFTIQLLDSERYLVPNFAVDALDTVLASQTKRQERSVFNILAGVSTFSHDGFWVLITPNCPLSLYITYI